MRSLGNVHSALIKANQRDIWNAIAKPLMETWENQETKDCESVISAILLHVLGTHSNSILVHTPTLSPANSLDVHSEANGSII